MGQPESSQAVCCQTDNYEKSKRAEWTFSEGGYPDCLPELQNRADCMPEIRGLHPEEGLVQAFLDPAEFRCCTNEEPADSAASLETLTYTPVRFDVKSTIDLERSQNRYSKIVMHGARARTQRRSKVWEEWLRAAAAGRTVTLLTGTGFQSPDVPQANVETSSKVQAMYYLDKELTKLSIYPKETPGESPIQPITILVQNIQVICPLTDFMLLSDTVEAQLDESERARAALLQFKTESAKQRRVCFLEESEDAKDRFVQALTALWLEKRSDHSMWF